MNITTGIRERVRRWMPLEDCFPIAASIRALTGLFFSESSPFPALSF